MNPILRSKKEVEVWKRREMNTEGLDLCCPGTLPPRLAATAGRSENKNERRWETPRHMTSCPIAYITYLWGEREREREKERER